MASDPAVRPVDTALLPGSAMASRAKAGGGSRLGWWLYALCGLLFGLYMGLNAVIGTSGVAAWKPMLWELSSVAVIFPILPLIVLYERRFPIDSTPRWRLILPHLCGALGIRTEERRELVIGRPDLQVVARREVCQRNHLVLNRIHPADVDAAVP